MWIVINDKGHFLVKDEASSKVFVAIDKADADWLCGVLDDVTDSIVKLFCQTPKCASNGGFITRVAQDARKNTYACDECGRPMTRKASPMPGTASEKQVAPVVTHNQQVATMVPSNMTTNAPRTPDSPPPPKMSMVDASHIEARMTRMEEAIAQLVMSFAETTTRAGEPVAENPEAPTTLPG